MRTGPFSWCVSLAVVVSPWLAALSKQGSLPAPLPELVEQAVAAGVRREVAELAEIAHGCPGTPPCGPCVATANISWDEVQAVVGNLTRVDETGPSLTNLKWFGGGISVTVVTRAAWSVARWLHGVGVGGSRVGARSHRPGFWARGVVQ